MAKRTLFMESYKRSKKRKWGIECPECKERLFSWHVHDFHYCKGGHVFIDGGDEYLRFSFTKDNKKPRRIYWTIKDIKPCLSPRCEAKEIVCNNCQDK